MATLLPADVEVLDYISDKEDGVKDYRKRGTYRKLYVRITFPTGGNGAANLTNPIVPSAFGLAKFTGGGVLTSDHATAPTSLFRLDVCPPTVTGAGVGTHLLGYRMPTDAAAGAYVDITAGLVLTGTVEGIDDTDTVDA